MNNRLIMAGVVGASVLLLSPGCASDAQTGSLFGAGIGALAGQAIGGNTSATLIGAGAGALGGYIVGNEMDKSKQRQQDQRNSNY